MMMSKSGIIDLTKPSLLGIVSFKEGNTELQLRVYKQFWNTHAYLPSTTEIYDFIYAQGYRHISNPKFTWVM